MVTRSDPLGSVVWRDHVKSLNSMGIETVEDLLRHYPRRYYERGELMSLSDLRVGEHVTVQVSVDRVDRVFPRNPRSKSGPFTVITLTDGKSRIKATFFNDKYMHKTVRPQQTVVIAGEVGMYRGVKQFTHPEIELDADPDDVPGRIGPIYPATKAISSWSIRRSVRKVLDAMEWEADPLPQALRDRLGLIGEADALLQIHRPVDWGPLNRARKRLKWDEAFTVQLALAQRRLVTRADPAVPRPRRSGGLLDAFDARLPFALTDGQQQVGEELFAELESPFPMHRLLQGEVGSGKTVVALRAMLAVIDAGGQAALLAPTEVLAQQHHRSITSLLGPLAEAGRLGGADVATRIALLTGSLPAARKRQELLDAASGTAGIVIGTHALLEKQVQFAELGLVVVDEQHRFGVEQRDALRGKATSPPHLLVMTATPIPRTVAMTVFGDLEVSTLRELPQGRSPIATTVVPVADRPDWLNRVWERVREEVTQGRRAYVVCARIDPGGSGNGPADSPEIEVSHDGYDGDEGLWEDGVTVRPPAAALTVVYDELTTGPLQGLRLAMLHGRLPAEEKDDIMRAFAAGDIDVLVATTVIEVGVDVPAATAMVILDADRFGISQLHQLRGRVGRGSEPGLCLMVTSAPADTPARDRLDGVAATLDGFELANLDLEQRREGDVLGARQSGRRSSFRLLQLLRDEEVIVAARGEATDVIAADPELTGHPQLAAAVAALSDEGRADYLAKA